MSILSGVIKKAGDNFVLESKDQKIFRLNCHSDDRLKYLNRPVKVHGILLQGYDNPKYGDQNFPISQIESKDAISVVTGISIEPYSQK